jgi:putative Mg2+ transporter-C (MgtC) family protein
MSWLYSDWNHLLPSLLGKPALMLVAMGCGAFIGLERQKHEKPAGLRTLILVCMGSAGFTMAGFAIGGDSGRVAAQIVTGIGFLGAGVILHPRGNISGATTAASIWITASIGMLAGAGYAGGAIGMACLVRFVLSAVGVYEWRLYQRQPQVGVVLDFDPSAGRTRIHLDRILIDYGIYTTAANWISEDPTLDRLTLNLRLPTHHLRELLDDLVTIPEVKRITEKRTAT